MPFYLRFIFAIILLGTTLGTHAANEGIHADFHTSLGDFSVLLHPVEAPQAVANFIGLAEGGRSWIDPTTGAVVSGKPFYNGLVFHRVIRGFMNQGGCPLGDGSSGPGYSFRDEFNPALTHDRAYRLSMANSGPNSNGSQFFITAAATPWLDGVHTVFGTVESGTQVVDAINGVSTGVNDKPLVPVVILTVGIRRVGAEAASFNPASQGLPVCRGSKGHLDVRRGIEAVWLMDNPQPGGSILRGFRSTNLQAWSMLGERYQNPGPSDISSLTLDSAENTRAFYQLSLTEYPGALGTSDMAGRALIAELSATTRLAFQFDATGVAGTGSYQTGAGAAPFTFTLLDDAPAPYNGTWVLQTSAYGALRVKCGLDSGQVGGTIGRHSTAQWNGLYWNTIASGKARAANTRRAQK